MMLPLIKDKPGIAYALGPGYRTAPLLARESAMCRARKESKMSIIGIDLGVTESTGPSSPMSEADSSAPPSSSKHG